MLAKLKSIQLTNKIKPIYLKIKQFFAKTASFYKKMYKKSYAAMDVVGKKIVKRGISANFVTIIGFVIGLLAINFLSLEKYGYALICIIINRIFDALDGAIARNSKVTDFGVFLDASLDYMFYAGIIFGFALANPEQNAIAASFLLFTFAAAACALLAYAVIAYKNNVSEEFKLGQSPFYLGGLAQGFETLVALLVLCIVPSLFMQIAIILGVLCLVKAFSVIVTAYYNFVIAVRVKK